MSSLAVTLTGRYVTLTPLSMDDVPDLVRAASGDRSTYGWSIVPDNTDKMANVVRRLLVDRDQRSAVPFSTRRTDTSEIIGMTRFLTLRWYFERDYPDAAEIGGTFLTATAQRTVANTEAKLLMLTHAFDVWGVRRVDLKTDERNERSRRAIERIGGRFEGVLRNWQAAQVDGEEGLTRNSAMYSILLSEWPEVRVQIENRVRG
ncbi:MAG TPA: GNAT family protein [Acidimicrobiales bacterium]|nr:GNAT family protein [Acidimicrobiales bacterium]